MDEEASIILGDAIAFCQRDGQDARLINMLGQSRAISLTEDTLTIEAPSRFAIAQLKKHQPTIEAYLEEMIAEQDALSGDYNRFWDERNYTNGAENLKCSALIIHGGAGLRRRRADNRAPAQRCFP